MEKVIFTQHLCMCVASFLTFDHLWKSLPNLTLFHKNLFNNKKCWCILKQYSQLEHPLIIEYSDTNFSPAAQAAAFGLQHFNKLDNIDNYIEVVLNETELNYTKMISICAISKIITDTDSEDIILSLNIIPHLVKALRVPTKKLQFEILNILSNISGHPVAGDKMGQFMGNLGVLPLLKLLIKSDDINVASAAINVCGNLFSCGKGICNYMTDCTGLPETLCEFIEINSNSQLVSISGAVWALVNLCRFRVKQHSSKITMRLGTCIGVFFAQILQQLPAIRDKYVKRKISKIFSDGIWLLNFYLLSGDQIIIGESYSKCKIVELILKIMSLECCFRVGYGLVSNHLAVIIRFLSTEQRLNLVKFCTKCLSYLGKDSKINQFKQKGVFNLVFALVRVSIDQLKDNQQILECLFEMNENGLVDGDLAMQVWALSAINGTTQDKKWMLKKKIIKLACGMNQLSDEGVYSVLQMIGSLGSDNLAQVEAQHGKKFVQKILTNESTKDDDVVRYATILMNNLW